MILYANGDSHTFGIGINPAQTFCNIFATHMGYDLINHAKIGASNSRILRTTREFLSNTIPDFVMIGWTTWEREEWIHDGKFFDVNSAGHDALPYELQDRYKHWVANQTFELMNSLSEHWHDKIYQFHQELQAIKIPHIFFNCMYNFFNATERDWEGCYIYPYDTKKSYYWYLHDRGYITDEWYHFGPDGHKAWANVLIDHATS